MRWIGHPRGGVFLIAVGCVVASGAACAPDACQGESPALELRVRSAVETSSITVTIGFGGVEYQRAFDVSEQIGDGVVSLVVDLDGAPDRKFPVVVEVVSSDGAQGDTAFDASPDACNVTELDLTKSTPDAGVRDAGPTDAGDVDGGQRDAGDGDAGEADGGEPDAGEPDAGEPDAGEPDAGVDTCPITTDADTVALYQFESDANDETNRYDGIASPGSMYGDGPKGCGQAVSFGGGANVATYIEVPDNGAFDLSEGAVEAFVQLQSQFSSRRRTLFSRESAANESGELAIDVACGGTVVATFDDGSSRIHRCSDNTISAGQFVHVGVNFGPAGFDLYVDGDRATRGGFVGFDRNNCTGQVACGGNTTIGIDGNDNPLIIGASNRRSTVDTTDDLQSPFRSGRIDSVRISSANRSF